MLINIVDVVDGALVNAIALTGRRVSVAVDGLRDRRRATDLTAARWFDTCRLTGETPDLPDLSPALTQRLADILRGDETQAAQRTEASFLTRYRQHVIDQHGKLTSKATPPGFGSPFVAASA